MDSSRSVPLPRPIPRPGRPIEQILSLQSAAGNRAVNALLSSRAPQARVLVQRSLQEPSGNFFKGMLGLGVWRKGAKAEEYWKRFGDDLTTRWAKSGVFPPPNILSILQACINADEVVAVDALTKMLRDDDSVKPIDGKARAAADRGTEITIPSILHFYWAGKQIKDATLHQLAQWAGRARGTNWKIWLWFDGAGVAGARDAGKLADNITVMKITPEIIDPRLRRTYERIIERGNPKCYPAASDLMRYSILYRYGGVYADVDFGPGNMDFNSPLKIHDGPPIRFAPPVRDGGTVDHWYRNPSAPPRPDNLRDAVRLMVARQRGRGEMFNNGLIAAPPWSEIMDIIIDGVQERVAHHVKEYESNNDAKAPDAGWAGELDTETTSAVTGPFAIYNAISRNMAAVQATYIHEFAPAPEAARPSGASSSASPSAAVPSSASLSAAGPAPETTLASPQGSQSAQPKREDDFIDFCKRAVSDLDLEWITAQSERRKDVAGERGRERGVD